MSNKNKTAYEEASTYLANRMRTAFEMKKHLLEKGYEISEIEEVIDELTQLRYLDDYEYAVRYFEYNREKKRGSKRAARELLGRGVDEAVIKNALEDYIYKNSVNEYEDALKIALEGIDGMVVDDRAVSGIARKLEAKGFANGDIFRILDEVRALDRNRK